MTPVTIILLAVIVAVVLIDLYLKRKNKLTTTKAIEKVLDKENPDKKKWWKNKVGIIIFSIIIIIIICFCLSLFVFISIKKDALDSRFNISIIEQLHYDRVLIDDLNFTPDLDFPRIGLATFLNNLKPYMCKYNNGELANCIVIDKYDEIVCIIKDGKINGFLKYKNVEPPLSDNGLTYKEKDYTFTMYFLDGIPNGNFSKTDISWHFHSTGFLENGCPTGKWTSKSDFQNSSWNFLNGIVEYKDLYPDGTLCETYTVLGNGIFEEIPRYIGIRESYFEDGRRKESESYTETGEPIYQYNYILSAVSGDYWNSGSFKWDGGYNSKGGHSGMYYMYDKYGNIQTSFPKVW